MKDDKKDFVSKQFEEAKYKDGQDVQSVTCGCGLRAPLRFMHKCCYCDEFYCFECAQVHFGKTREKYELDKLNKPEENHF